MQRVDIARFSCLYAYGGLYADLDVAPNREEYPQVTLGLCKMAARATSKPPEWEMELVVGERGNEWLMRILRNMVTATLHCLDMDYYVQKPCRYIYNSTGPVAMASFLKKSGYEPTIVFFSMCRPIEDLENKVSCDETGRIGGYDAYLARFDVLSAFSMSYKGQEAYRKVPLATEFEELPAFPVIRRTRIRRKGPCPWLNPFQHQHVRSPGYEPTDGEYSSEGWFDDSPPESADPTIDYEPAALEIEDEGLAFLSGSGRASNDGFQAEFPDRKRFRLVMPLSLKGNKFR